MSLTPGTRLGPYEVQSAIGAGGMGEVFRATDTRLKREVAIKVLPRALASEPGRLARFQREAEVLASLNHPHIAAIYGLEELDGLKALVLELVEGPTLADRIASGPLSVDEALAIARQIADALDAAHEKGIVHRDLKPANVKLTSDGQVKVLDFGLAKAMEAEPGGDVPAGASMSPTMTSPAMTQVGVILGTAAYMSPEQARGRAVDARADIWAFGVVLYEMMTGATLFSGDTVTDVLAAVVTKEPDWSRVPAALRPLLERCLQKDPKRRLRHIGDLDLLLTTTTAVTTATRPASWMPWSAAAAFAVLAAGTAAWSLTNAPATSPAADPLQFEIVPRQVRSEQLAVSISPDGRMLMYRDSGADGRPMLFLRRLDEIDAVALKGTEDAPPGRSFWTADSRFLVFLSNAESLSKVRVPDGRPERLGPAVGLVGGTSAPDGTLILATNGLGLQRMPASGGDLQPLTTPDPALGDQEDRLPMFLPDGRHFLFHRSSSNPQRNAIWVASLEAPGVSTVVAPADRGTFAGVLPAVGPAVVFVRDQRVYAQAFDLDRLTVTGEPRGGLSIDSVLSVSQNGVMAYSAQTEQGGAVLAWYDRRGKVLSSQQLGEAYRSFDVSPDGRRLSFARRNEADGNVDLWSRDLVTGTEVRLTRAPAQETNAVWSPDGARVAFSAPLQRNAVVQIHVRPSNGTGTETPVVSMPEATWVNDWSPDGRFLLFAAQGGRDLFYRPMDEPNATPKPYVTEPSAQREGQFSPDGRFVAYISDESGQHEVYVRPFPDAAAGKWVVSTRGGLEPRWNRDGRELFYREGQAIMKVNVTLTPAFSAGAPEKLFEAPIDGSYTGDNHRWQVSPDGQRFLLQTFPDSRAVPIRVIVNWPALLEK
jgi:eukaryotic-like serine/threonine-protein kinase